MSRFIDLVVEQGEDGIFDLVIDENTQDFKTTDGLETAASCSLFTDRRAYESEVPDPMERRGWIGVTVSPDPRDWHSYGSGLWFYEQSRLTEATAAGVRQEAVQSLDWMQHDQLIEYSEAIVAASPKDRSLSLLVTLNFLDGGTSQRAYILAKATTDGIISRF